MQVHAHTAVEHPQSCVDSNWQVEGEKWRIMMMTMHNIHIHKLSKKSLPKVCPLGILGKEKWSKWTLVQEVHVFRSEKWMGDALRVILVVGKWQRGRVNVEIKGESWKSDNGEIEFIIQSWKIAYKSYSNGFCAR